MATDHHDEIDESLLDCFLELGLKERIQSVANFANAVERLRRIRSTDDISIWSAGDLRVRQWMLTLPHRLRYALAYDHRLCRTVLDVFVRALLAFERRRARGILGHGGAHGHRRRVGAGRDERRM